MTPFEKLLQRLVEMSPVEKLICADESTPRETVEKLVDEAVDAFDLDVGVLATNDLPDVIVSWRADASEQAAMKCLTGKCSRWDLEQLADCVKSVRGDLAASADRDSLLQATTPALAAIGGEMCDAPAAVRRRWPEVIRVCTGLDDVTGPALLTAAGWGRVKRAMADFERKAIADEVRPVPAVLARYSRKLLSIETLAVMSLFTITVGVVWIGWAVRGLAR